MPSLSRFPQAQQMPTARPLSSAAALPSAINHQPPDPSTTMSTELNQLRIDECRPHRIGLST
jgi:hypothetical protein